MSKGFLQERFSMGSSKTSWSSIAGARLARLRAVEDEESDPVPLDVSAVWNPNPPVEDRPTYDNGKSPQELFWDIDCDEVLYGGAAGGGETAASAAVPPQRGPLPRWG